MEARKMPRKMTAPWSNMSTAREEDDEHQATKPICPQDQEDGLDSKIVRCDSKRLDAMENSITALRKDVSNIMTMLHKLMKDKDGESHKQKTSKKNSGKKKKTIVFEEPNCDEDDENVVSDDCESIGECNFTTKAIFQKPSIDLTKYDGTSSFSKWLQDVNPKLSCMGFSNKDKCAYLPQLMIGKAKRMYHTVKRSQKRGKFKTFKTMIEALRSKFSMSFSEVISITPEIQVKQGINETVADYTDKIIERFEKYEVYDEQERLRRYFDGLRCDIQSKVLLIAKDANGDMNYLEQCALQAERCVNCDEMASLNVMKTTLNKLNRMENALNNAKIQNSFVQSHAKQQSKIHQFGDSYMHYDNNARDELNMYGNQDSINQNDNGISNCRPTQIYSSHPYVYNSYHNDGPPWGPSAN